MLASSKCRFGTPLFSATVYVRFIVFILPVHICGRWCSPKNIWRCAHLYLCWKGMHKCTKVVFFYWQRTETPKIRKYYNYSFSHLGPSYQVRCYESIRPLSLFYLWRTFLNLHMVDKENLTKYTCSKAHHPIIFSRRFSRSCHHPCLQRCFWGVDSVYVQRYYISGCIRQIIAFYRNFSG